MPDYRGGGPNPAALPDAITCEVYGHEFRIITVHESPDPLMLVCTRCPATWRVTPR